MIEFSLFNSNEESRLISLYMNFLIFVHSFILTISFTQSIISQFISAYERQTNKQTNEK